MPDKAAEQLHDLLSELGSRWATSERRLHPSPIALRAWDDLLNKWVHSDLPLILRIPSRRGTFATHFSGRRMCFSDNGPAHWAFDLALQGQTPELSETVVRKIPLTFLDTSSSRTLNKAGWKVCHIAPVSDRKRKKPEERSLDEVKSHFLRFLNPRNMFLIPMKISGVGEIPAVIDAIKAFENNR